MSVVPPVASVRVLHVDDNPDDRALVERALLRHLASASVIAVGTPEDLDAAIAADAFDVVVLDYQLRWSNGIDVLQRLKRDRPRRPVVMFTASGSEEIAVRAMKAGVDDYVTKTPQHYARLPYAVEACLARAAQRTRLDDALAALERSEEEFRTLFELSSTGTVRADPTTGRLLRVNRRFCEIAGRAEHDLVGRTFSELTHPEDRATDCLLVARLLRGETDHWEVEKRYLRPDGSVVWVHVFGRYIRGSNGEPPHAVASVIDVSARKEAERQLALQAEALRLADRRKDEFLAILSHELRNPLAPLTTAHRVLERSEALTELGRRTLALAQRQARHLTRLVDDLLEMTRITHDIIALRTERIALAPLVAQVIEAAAPIAAARGQRLTVDMPAQALELDADPVRIAQVLENLVGNAIKYTPDDGSIRIEGRALHDVVEIRVEDDGIGIEPARIPELFAMFARIDDAETPERGGLGIGLALVKRLVELHGGSVRAESAGLGRGAAFIVRLPSRPRQA